MKNLESRPFSLTRCLKTPSAAGLRQMFPRQTNSTENGLLLCALSFVAEEAIDDAFVFQGFIDNFLRLDEICLDDWRNEVCREDRWQFGNFRQVGVKIILVHKAFIEVSLSNFNGENSARGVVYGLLFCVFSCSICFLKR